MSNTTKTGGIGFLTALGLLFIGLKVGGVISWLAPVWGPWTISLAVIFVLAAVVGRAGMSSGQMTSGVAGLCASEDADEPGA